MHLLHTAPQPARTVQQAKRLGEKKRGGVKCLKRVAAVAAYAISVLSYNRTSGCLSTKLQPSVTLSQYGLNIRFLSTSVPWTENVKAESQLMMMAESSWLPHHDHRDEDSWPRLRHHGREGSQPTPAQTSCIMVTRAID
eukprot:367293-Rhodomonas_salina.1